MKKPKIPEKRIFIEGGVFQYFNDIKIIRMIRIDNQSYIEPKTLNYFAKLPNLSSHLRCIENDGLIKQSDYYDLYENKANNRDYRVVLLNKLSSEIKYDEIIHFIKSRDSEIRFDYINPEFGCQTKCMYTQLFSKYLIYKLSIHPIIPEKHKKNILKLFNFMDFADIDYKNNILDSKKKWI